MVTWGKNQQVCASCRYWSGQREIDFSASHFTVEADEQGRCNGPRNSFRGNMMAGGSSCSAWEVFRSDEW
ncbi:hypothetical protein [Heliorestis convoluta]|uniref:Uncharacterized protein n=1 Tax=Heliorestis convoluta TaxID=356322 RepID=A0A5Q2N6V9_9FIRM|nr:hypothetical protein [Heliorestis convoluta]QGG48010.1 hypothetical protein FTV88_1912 [Heliorestis convoluta]